MSFNKSLGDEKYFKNYSELKFSDSTICYGPFPNLSKTSVKKINGVKENIGSSRHLSSKLTSTEKKTSCKTLPEITAWRRALTKDKPAIKQLQTLTGNVANFLYRKRNIDELIEKSYFPIVQLDSKGELISFTAYDSYPNIPSVPSFFWSDWLNSTYRLKGANSRNVLFVHYMVWQPEQENRFLHLLLESSFTEFLHLKHIIIVKPPLTNVPEFYTKYFFPVLPLGLEKLEFDSIQTLLVCLRTSIIHPLKVRTAVNEECDIVFSVINEYIQNNHPGLKEKYVLDFFSCIYQHDKKTLICELEGHIAGVMILNLNMDLNLLNEGFELAPFHGLRKRNKVDEEVKNCQESELFLCEETPIIDNDNPSLLVKKKEKGLSSIKFCRVSGEGSFNQMNSENPNNTDNFKNKQSLSSDNELVKIHLLASATDAGKKVYQEESVPKQGSSSVFKLPNDLNELPFSKTGALPSRVPSNKEPFFYLPKYRGKSNAFVIEFFGIDCSKVNEKLSSLDFLQAAFRTIPDREYCILIMPTGFLPFPLLDLFIRVTPKSVLTQEFYLCHKNSLSITMMDVRYIEEEDADALNDFLKSVEEYNVIEEDIWTNYLIENTEVKSFVFEVEDEIVGVSLIECQKYEYDFRLLFEGQDSKKSTTDHSVIKHLILHPIYQNHARFIIHDLIRLADVHCLYCICCQHKEYRSKISVLRELVPLKPKRKAALDDNLRSFLPLKVPFGLYYLNTSECSLTKIRLSIVIVVVGASQTAFSFLENLIFGSNGSHVIYDNLICVTPRSLDLNDDEGEIQNLMFPLQDKFSKQYLSMLSLETHVTFIYGLMTEINRSEKYIIVNNEITVKYDYLILTCGLQYLVPVPKVQEAAQVQCKRSFQSSLSRFLMGSKKTHIAKHPNNLFLVNNSSEAKHSLRAIQFLMSENKSIKYSGKKIIVYGHNLNTFLTIHALLNLGIPGEIIVFVEPFPCGTFSVTTFNDPYVDQAVLNSVKKNKVTHYKEFFLYDWSISSENNISAIIFHSKYKKIVVPCLAFFPFVKKMVSDVTYKACSSAGLVYDGKLVINHNFRTNDRYIYAAGPFTKYARRYFASHQDHQFYNSVEVGQKLANIIKSDILPRIINGNEKDTLLVPVMKAPLCTQCQLPEGFNYLTVKKPGKELDLETSYNFIDYGEVLVTGDCQMKSGYGYFRLQLNPQGFVESVTCYTKDKIDYGNLTSLYGLHEKLLNDLLLRFDLTLIPDLYSYFREPWTVAIFHEDFKRLRECNAKAFHKKFSKGNEESFIKMVVQTLVQNNWDSLPEETKLELETSYLNSTVENEIKNNVIDFLEIYKDDFTTYTIPSSLKFKFRRS